MGQKIKNYSFVEKFKCLADKCEDTCCRGWGMQLDTVRKELYEKEAPELMDAVTSGEADLIMKRDPKTDFCVKFKDGMCKIHEEKGDKFLGDACHFYPRATRKFGDEIIMSAAISCPEIARLTIFEDDAFKITEREIERLPVEIKDYLPKGVTSDKALGVIEAIMKMVEDESITPENAMAKVVVISNSLKNVSSDIWSDGINMLIGMVESRMSVPENDYMDIYNILHTLAGLVHASKKTTRSNFEEIFKKMEEALGIEIKKDNLEIMVNVGQEDYPQKLLELWNKKAKEQAKPILRRWILAQLALSSFPYSGFGKGVADIATMMAVRFATVRLALMAHMDEKGNLPEERKIVKIVQSLSRFMDHLADPELSMNLYTQAGWTQERRIRSLVGDF